MRTWDKREVLSFLDRVEPVLAKLDFYELLDVLPDANDDAIQAAFHGMAAALHPDRHRRSLNPAQRERLTIVYARIAEAYRVLRDPEKRTAYLREAARANAERRRGAAPATGAVGTAGARPGATPGASAQPPDDSLDEATQLARISPKASRLYRRAQAALRTGDRASALLNLRLALAAHPTSTLIKAALRELDRK